MPHKGDSSEILDRVHIKYVLPKRAFMSKTVAIFVQNGPNLAKRWLFTSVIQGTNAVVG